MKRHWTEQDFIVKQKSRDGDYGCQSGSCRVCGKDMQRFWREDHWGPIVHYESHKYLRREA